VRSWHGTQELENAYLAWWGSIAEVDVGELDRRGGDEREESKEPLHFECEG
jgi:hypothetical protein